MTVDLPGFADPVADAQACFRAVLDAIAHPGRVVRVGSVLHPPSPLTVATAAVLLTLADATTPVWLDDAIKASTTWLRFHCGAPEGEQSSAAFAVCEELPALETFNWGSHDGPETSATIILQRPTLNAGPRLRLSGPGLRKPEDMQLGLPDDFASRWKANHAGFPRGVDLVICAGNDVAALPRSVRVEAL